MRCATLAPHFEAVRAWAEFNGPLRNALHDLKYRKNIGLGESLSKHLEYLLQQLNWNIQVVAPVPLGRERQRQRGYNQAALIAKPLALALQLPYNPQIIFRSRDTQSQVDLSLRERRKNLKNAFQAESKCVANKQVLMIDDVATSCSTIDACAEALKKAGANAVYGLTVARAVLKN
jgi:competence protein ComFC